MAGGQGEEGFRGSYQAELTGLAQSTLRCLASCLQFVPCPTNHDLTTRPLPVLPPGIQYFRLEFSTSAWNSVLLPGIQYCLELFSLQCPVSSFRPQLKCHHAP